MARTNILTRQDVECVVEKSFGANVNLLNYKVESYSSESLGFMGAHRNLVVEVSRDNGSKDTRAYFLKSFPREKKSQAKFIEDNGIFRKEVGFYNSIMPELMKNSEDKSWVAQCYLAKKDVLVFENLKLKNYAMKGECLDVASLKAALSSLAKMHAASILAEKRLGRTFLEMFPELMEKEVIFSLKGPFAGWYRSGVVICTKVAEKLGLRYENVPKVGDMILEKVLPSKTRRNVISHGDTWSNNLMFNGDDNCTLVDFQFMRYVPAMVDVAQAIHFNMRRDSRKKHEKKLLEHYYDTFCDALMIGGMDVPSFQDILDEYEEMRVVGVVTISLYFPTIHIGDERMKRMLENAEGFQDLFGWDRLNSVMDVMAKDERYREIVESVVRELVDFSETLYE